MQNKLLFFLIFGILVLCLQIAVADEIIVEDADAVWDLTLDNITDAPIAPGNETIAEEAATTYNLTVDNATNAPVMLGDEIIVVDADTVWNLTLDNATAIGRLVGEPGVMVTRYADTLVYYLLANATDVGRLVGEPGVIVTKYADTLRCYLLENATDVGRLVGEPGVMVTRYADTLSCYSLENATEIHHLVGEPGVMVTRYADTFMYEGLTAPPFVQYVEYFDTGKGTYPSIMGTHNGTITPSDNITVNKMYTYPCLGTGGHTEYARIWNPTLDTNATWNGYTGDWHNISFNKSFTLVAGETYNYTIKTGSYPQIIHEPSKEVTGGVINCTEFVDANGEKYNDWIPAIRLW